MRLEKFQSYLEYRNQPANIQKNRLVFSDTVVPVRNGIPRFTPDLSYSSGNFSKLREKHATLQLDSRNGTTARYDTLLERTGWPAEYFKGKTVLECGCGAGPDTEILLSLGAKVISADIAGVDIAAGNLPPDADHCLIQASILDLPLKKHAFDIVFCHRVIMHTPDPQACMDHILGFVKPGGDAFVHSYARSWQQMLRWKYLMLPFTRRMEPEKLYRAIKKSAPAMMKLTDIINKVPGGKYVNHVFVPFRNYRGLKGFESYTDAQLLEYGIHDTFDALAPRYDKPLSAKTMKTLAEKHLDKEFEIIQRRTITYLRTLAAPAQPKQQTA